MKGKRFVFSTIAIIAVTVATVFLKYDGKIYIQLVGIIAGIFTLGQTITDTKKGVKDDKPH